MIHTIQEREEGAEAAREVALEVLGDQEVDTVTMVTEAEEVDTEMITVTVLHQGTIMVTVPQEVVMVPQEVVTKVLEVDTMTDATMTEDMMTDTGKEKDIATEVKGKTEVVDMIDHQEETTHQEDQKKITELKEEIAVKDKNPMILLHPMVAMKIKAV